MGLMSVRRLSLATVMSLCAFTGSVLFSVPEALAVTPPVVEEESALNVAGTSATLQAKIDPQGSETTYRFEYGTSEAYGSQIPVPDGLVGSGLAGVTVSAHPQDLSPSTAYHYRVLAVVASRSETVPGSDRTFTTQPAGGEFALPDGRQWELVSPPNKYGALIQSLSHEGPIQASEDGSRIAYGVNVPTELEPAGYGSGVEQFIQVLSARGAGAWSSRDIATPHNSWTGSTGRPPEYQLFSKDLSLGLADPLSEDGTLLSNQASEPTPYIRRESLCDAPATAGECYLPVLTGKEGFADVPPGTEFGQTPQGGTKVSFEGASPDLSHILVKSLPALTTTPTTQKEIYEWSAGVPAAEALQLISLLPASEGGGPATPGGGVGTVSIGFSESGRNAGVRHSISDDGSRIFWTAAPTADGGPLYMRDTVKQESVRLDVQQPGAPSGGEPEPIFQIASSDGSKVFFTDGSRSETVGQRLTAQSGAQGQDLYECEIVEEAGRLACRLTDLTPEREGHPAEVQNIVSGASEDGSYVYFVADSVLGENKNSEGESATHGTCKPGTQSNETCNLYEYHNGAITFIATLSGVDEYDWGRGDSNSTIYHGIAYLTARVSPDGRYLAFMSNRSLTGYDNRDAVSGKPDMEVYLHDALTGRLACVSCNPTGSRPVGVEVDEFFDLRPNVVAVRGGNGETRVAANLPPGNEVEGDQSLYLPRALSDSGRVFFNSNDALVSQDANGQEDVYEFEPEGTGGCVVSSVTFSPKTGGCVSLISSGTSPEESGFMDASKDGGDVFFLTTGRLTSQDYDTAFDVYDAHECSVVVPCVAPPVASPPCASGDACKGAPSPQPQIFGAPASATFAGRGNVLGSPSIGVVRPRSLTRAQKLARALKACRKKPKKRRGVCERQVRKRYAAKAGRRVTAATRKGQG
jgi:hypothetical protein